MGRAWPALIALASGQFVVGVTSLSPVGMVAELGAEFAVAPGAVARLLTLFAVVYALSAPLTQAWLGHLPRRAVIGAAMATSGLACLALALSESWWQVQAARVAMAGAAGLIGPSAAAAAAGLVAPERRAGALAVVFGGITASSVLGLPTSSWLAQTLGWREAWAAVGAAALLCALAVALTVPGGARGARGSLAALASVLSARAPALTVAATATLFAGGFVTYSLQAVWLVRAAGAPLALVPAVLFAYGCVGLCANLLSGRVTRRLGVERTIAAGLALAPCGALAMWAAPGTPWIAFPGFALMGAAWLMIMAPIQARLVRLCGERAPLALAFNASALYVGMAAGSALSGPVLAFAGAAWLPLATALGMALAFLVFLASRRGEALAPIRARP